MNKEQFKELQKRTSILFKLKTDKLASKSIEMHNAFHNYYEIYVDQYKNFQNLLTAKDKLYGELYNKHRFDNQKETRKKIEIDPFIHSDEQYYQLCLKINEQEHMVKYLEGICDSIKRLSYNIKNIIDLKNLGEQI